MHLPQMAQCWDSAGTGLHVKLRPGGGCAFPGPETEIS